jgi:hypothetical protein
MLFLVLNHNKFTKFKKIFKTVKLLLKNLKEFGLNVNLCVGIGTDRCLVMT